MCYILVIEVYLSLKSRTVVRNIYTPSLCTCYIQYEIILNGIKSEISKIRCKLCRCFTVFHLEFRCVYRIWCYRCAVRSLYNHLEIRVGCQKESTFPCQDAD